jgi:hypothetical protein
VRVQAEAIDILVDNYRISFTHMLYWNGNGLVVSAAKARCKSFSKEGLA